MNRQMNDFFAGVECLLAHDGSTGRVGVTGFCYGGGVASYDAARRRCRSRVGVEPDGGVFQGASSLTRKQG